MTEHSVGVEDIEVWFLEQALVDPKAAEVLSSEERARAARFHAAIDHDRYVARRVRLRQLLAGYLDRDPAEIEYDIGPQGKLAVEGIYFNVSRSQGKALYAFSRDRVLGVDIEALGGGHDLESLQSALSPAERERFTGLPERERESFVLRTWTRKEALVKAIGVGLAVTPSTFAAQSGDVIMDDPRPRQEGSWRLTDLPAPNGFIAAVSAAGPRRFTMTLRS